MAYQPSLMIYDLISIHTKVCKHDAITNLAWQQPHRLACTPPRSTCQQQRASPAAGSGPPSPYRLMPRVHRENGKENGNYENGLYRDYIGDILRLYWGYIGRMEKKMETITR